MQIHFLCNGIFFHIGFGNRPRYNRQITLFTVCDGDDCDYFEDKIRKLKIKNIYID